MHPPHQSIGYLNNRSFFEQHCTPAHWLAGLDWRPPPPSPFGTLCQVPGDKSANAGIRTGSRSTGRSFPSQRRPRTTMSVQWRASLTGIRRQSTSPFPETTRDDQERPVKSIVDRDKQSFNAKQLQPVQFGPRGPAFHTVIPLG